MAVSDYCLLLLSRLISPQNDQWSCLCVTMFPHISLQPVVCTTRGEPTMGHSQLNRWHRTPWWDLVLLARTNMQWIWWILGRYVFFSVNYEAQFLHRLVPLTESVTISVINRGESQWCWNVYVWVPSNCQKTMLEVHMSSDGNVRSARAVHQLSWLWGKLSVHHVALWGHGEDTGAESCEGATVLRTQQGHPLGNGKR